LHLKRGKAAGRASRRMSAPVLDSVASPNRVAHPPAGGRGKFCWAHLKRNLLGMVEFTKNSAVERFCRDALAEHARLFRLWHKFRGGQIDRGQLLLRSIPMQKRIFALAERHLGPLRYRRKPLPKPSACWRHSFPGCTMLEKRLARSPSWRARCAPAWAAAHK
jgi:hypothetical protein